MFLSSNSNCPVTETRPPPPPLSLSLSLSSLSLSLSLSLSHTQSLWYNPCIRSCPAGKGHRSQVKQGGDDGLYPSSSDAELTPRLCLCYALNELDLDLDLGLEICLPAGLTRPYRSIHPMIQVTQLTLPRKIRRSGYLCNQESKYPERGERVN